MPLRKSNPSRSARLESEYRNRVVKRQITVQIIGPDEVIAGSLTGRLLAITLHNTTRFELYPPAGPAKVACDFTRAIQPKVKDGLEQNVRVIGKLRYKHWAPYPHAITAEDIEIFPPNDTLPTLTSMRGLALRESANPDGH